MTETWKPLPRAPKYLVSDQGSILGVRGHLLKPIRNAKGYFLASIHSKQFLVPRLVLETFTGPCPPGQEARHLNGDNSDNKWVNLAWGTRIENAQDRIVHGTQNHGVKQWHSKLTPSQVIEIVSLEQQGVSQAEIAKQYGVPQSSVWKICRGHAWTRVTGLTPVEPGRPSGKSKLTEDQIDEIVRLCASGMSQESVAKLYGITQTGVCYRLRQRKLAL